MYNRKISTVILSTTLVASGLALSACNDGSDNHANHSDMKSTQVNTENVAIAKASENEAELSTNTQPDFETNNETETEVIKPEDNSKPKENPKKSTNNDAAKKTVDVQFKKGASSAKYTGQISGYDYDQYTFSANKGQKLKISLDGGNIEAYLFGNGIVDSVNLGEYSPDLDDDGNYILPTKGQYNLRVMQPREMARQDKKSQYNLTIAIH